MSYLKINDDLAVVDCDGVLLDFDRCYARVAADTLGRPVPKVCNQYVLHRRYGLTQAEAKRVWAALEDHELGWSGLRPLPGAAEAVAKLRAHGLRVHVVTAIEDRFAPARLANLLGHGIQVDGIDCVGDPTASKAGVIARLAPGMYVEDRLRLLHEAPFVPDRVWVDHADTQDGFEVTEEIIRVASLAKWVDQWAIRHGDHRPTRHLRMVG